MRACPSCGAANDPADDFCGNCGAYLGWSDEPTSPGTPAAPPPPAGSPERTAVPPVSTAGPGGDTGPDENGAAPVTAPDAPSGAPGDEAPNGAHPARGDDEEHATPQSAGPAPDAPAPNAPAPDTVVARTRGSLTGAARTRFPRPRTARPSDTPPTGTGDPVRPADPAPAPDPAPVPAARPPSAPATPVHDPVLPVLPAKAVAPRPVVRHAAVQDEGSGQPCPVCGTPNRPERKFCRRCAAKLRPAPKAAPLPWWRTVWPFRRRARAGSGRGVRFAVILAVVLALCAAGFLMLPAGRVLIEDVRDKLGKATPITPVRVEASGELPGHPATNTTDGLNNKYWAAPEPGASVTYTFRKPFRLVDLIITNGASTTPEAYARQARALQVDLEVTTTDGTHRTKEFTLSDKPGPHTIQTGISEVRTIRLTLRSPVDLSPERHLALAEVEFFKRG
ncbi:NADase-type glycan-binding domain-containing protein [Streptomyces sp. NPDC051563]|uniref:NADase-type glycan-binding domain-containing protein n=1 Tax=Streptomyces sp. NPDC051563 TaxID=3365659 RepID=UPI003797B438